MTNPKRRYSGNDVGYMEEECKANMRLRAENKRLREALADIAEKGHRVCYHDKGYALAILARNALGEDE